MGQGESGLIVVLESQPSGLYVQVGVLVPIASADRTEWIFRPAITLVRREGPRKDALAKLPCDKSRCPCVDFAVIFNGEPEQSAPNRLQIVENPFRANRRRQNGGPQVDLACAVEAEASIAIVRCSAWDRVCELYFWNGDVSVPAAGRSVKDASVALRPEWCAPFAPSTCRVWGNSGNGEVCGTLTIHYEPIRVNLSGIEAEIPRTG